MSNDAAKDKVIDIAEKITAKAENALIGLEREMIVMKWAPEFRVIIWETVAHIAMMRADLERQKSS